MFKLTDATKKYTTHQPLQKITKLGEKLVVEKHNATALYTPFKACKIMSNRLNSAFSGLSRVLHVKLTGQKSSVLFHMSW
jgi:hypothetical protein